MNNRDDFTQKTKDILRDRAGNRCSNPSCQAPTSAPSSFPNKKLNGGRAAHIYAAAPGGKRFNQHMTSEQRKDISNGIWLCERCASTIDQDELAHTVALLNQWKIETEEMAFRHYGQPQLASGQFDTEKELERARSFLSFLSVLHNDLRFGISSNGRVFPDTSSQVLGHIGCNFGINGWSNSHPLWSFNPSIKSKQDYIIHICKTLNTILNGSEWCLVFDPYLKVNVKKYKTNVYFLTEEDNQALGNMVVLEKLLYDTLFEFHNSLSCA